MTRLVKVVRPPLQLSLEILRVFPHPIEHARRETVEMLAELLLEALGTEEQGQEEEACDELED
jgi:hypothetical protein